MHDLEFHGMAAAREFSRLQPPDAVIGADAAAETLDQIEYCKLEHRPARDEALDVGVGLLAHVEMQVAVARVAVGDDVSFGSQAAHQRRSFFDERRDRRNRYR